MTLTVKYSPDGFVDPCDKCGVTDDRPAFTFNCYCEEVGHQCIWVHERCLEKAIAAAKQRALKAQAVVK